MLQKVWGLFFIFIFAFRAFSGQFLIETQLGGILVELDDVSAPENCQAFRRYFKDRVYDRSWFGRFDNGCVIGGKPSKKFPNLSPAGNMDCSKGAKGEFTLKQLRGSVGMCRTTGDCNPRKYSNSTQFFIRTTDQPENDGEFSIFGKVVEGMDVVDEISRQLNGKNEDVVKISFRIKNAIPTSP